MSNIIDLNNPPPNHRVEVAVSKLETSAEQIVRLTKDLTIFLFAIVFMSVIGWVCVDTLNSKTKPEEEKKWAMATITAIAGGVVGYLLKK